MSNSESQENQTTKNVYQHLFRLETDEEVHRLVKDSNRVPIVYHPNYNLSFYGIEHLHPFDGAKYEKIVNFLAEKKYLRFKEKEKGGWSFKVKKEKVGANPVRKVFIPQEIPTNEQLRLIHTEEYLKSLESSSTIASLCEFPPLYIFPSGFVYNKVVSPMLYQVGGTILAGRIAIDRGLAINLGGGMHHASFDQGGGWCVFSDIYLSLTNLRKYFPERVKRAMIIDLDVHQGNGIERDKLQLKDDDTFILDVYNPEIYPGDTFAYKAMNYWVRISPERSDQYNVLMKEALEESFRRFDNIPTTDANGQPKSSVDIVFYNAGSDILVGDPLNGGLTVTPEQVIERDEIVFQQVRSKNIPLVMVLSGGYTKPLSSQTISRSVQNLFDKGFFA